MDKDIRLEYLFPNKEKRVIENLFNMSLAYFFQHVIREKDVYNFTFEEFKKFFIFANREQISEEEFRRMYEIWLHGNVMDTLNLSVNRMNWDNSLTYKIAVALDKNPQQLPFFIESQAVSILGSFLGDPRLYEYSKEAYPNREFTFPHQMACEYKKNNFEGKYRLSLFLSVVDNLLDLGVNLEEFTFFHLLDAKCFRNASEAGLWNKDIANLSDKPFRRGDGTVFSKSQLSEFINFTNLSEFLQRIILLVDYEYQHILISSDMTIDSSEIIPISDFDYYDMSMFPQDNLISVKTLCKNMINKLRGVALNTELEINRRKKNLDSSEIEALSTKCEISVDPDMLREFIEFLLAKNYLHINQDNRLVVMGDLKEKSLTLAQDFLAEKKLYNSSSHPNYDDIVELIERYISVIVNVNITNIFVDSAPDIQEKDHLIGELVQKVDNLEKRQNSLEEKVEALSDELASFKEQILTYLETGQNKPDLSKLSPQKVTEIIKNIEVQSVGGKIRKRLLLMALALGMIGLLKSSNISLIGQFEDKNSVDSKPPVVDIIPPVSSQGVEEVLVTPTPETPEISQEEKISVHILDEDNGLRDYYTSIYDRERSGVTNQNGVIIRYFAFQNDSLIATFGREEELQNFVANNNVADFTWKIAVSCFDSGVLQSYLDAGDEIPLQYTTFFADYTPAKNITRLRKN